MRLAKLPLVRVLVADKPSELCALDVEEGFRSFAPDISSQASASAFFAERGGIPVLMAAGGTGFGALAERPRIG